MFKNIVGVHSRFAAFVIASVAAIAIGPVAKGADTAVNSDTETKQLAQARQMVQSVLNHWDWRTWNQLLADDVVLKMRLGTATKDAAGDPALLGMKVEYTGRDVVKKALREIYGDLRKEFQITTEIVHGPDVVLLGELVVTPKDKDPVTLPIAVHMTFNKAGKIESMGMFSVDVRALVAARQTAAPK